jgi:hypothetical protein
MATTVLSNPVVSIGTVSPGTSITTQVVSAVVTSSQEQLDSTAFGQTNRTYVGGLTNASITLTLLMDYTASSTYALLNSLVGAAATYVAVKATTAAISATNPEFQLTNGYLESFDVVNAQLGQLQQVECVFQGGTLVKDVTP